jgi:hypothetical protein
MTIKFYEHTHETWVVEEFGIETWGTHTAAKQTIHPTYEAAVDEITHLIALGGVNSAKIHKLYRPATPEEIRAEKDAQAAAFNWKTEHVQIAQNIEDLSGISEYQRGQTGTRSSLMYTDCDWQYHARGGLLIRYSNAKGQPPQVLLNDGSWRTGGEHAVRRGDERKVEAD